MKSIFWLIGLAVLLGLVWIIMSQRAAAQSGGPYELSWSNFDGSAGMGGGGAYQLEAVAGQPDAGTINGGLYELRGGIAEAGPPSGSPVTSANIYLPVIIRLK